jgi:hypothetical protein
MSADMSKFYLVGCFKEIGSFVRQVIWDGIDCHRVRMLGWIVESVDLEPLRFVHLRPQGASQNGIWTGRVRAGFGQYFMDISPLYHIAGTVHRLPTHPVLIGSVAMLRGYLTSWLKGMPRYDDLEFTRFLRSYWCKSNECIPTEWQERALARRSSEFHSSDFNYYQHACLRIGKGAGVSWFILGGQSRLYLPGIVASVSVAGFFLWFDIHRLRRTENSFADPI